jgi:ABC-type sugar transport system substrate-binding protein
MNPFRICLRILLSGVFLAACVPSTTQPIFTSTPIYPMDTMSSPHGAAAPMIVSTPTPALKTYKDMVVGLVRTGAESDWRTANFISFSETAKQLGITLEFYDYAYSPPTTEGMLKQQIAIFQQFIEYTKVNVIVILPIASTGWEESLQQSKDKGKVVIIADRRVDAPEDLYSIFVSSDFVEEGRTAGREMCKLLEGSQKKNVWELAGTEGSGTAIDRGKGFRKTAGECGITITQFQTANFITIEGKQVTEAWLKESRDVQGIFAQNDDMGLGAIEALKEAGLVPAEDVKIVSIDAKSAAFKAMLNGDLNVTVECNPMFAPQVYEAALAALNGETLPKWIPVKESVFRMDDPNLKQIAAGRKY